MQRAESVPQTEDGVHVVIGLVYFAVHAAVVAIHIIEDVRRYIAVVQRRVEGALLFARAAGNLDLVQLGVPCGFGLCPYRIEIPAGYFGFEVRARAFDAHGADADLDDEGSIELAEVERGLTMQPHVRSLLASEGRTETNTEV